MKRVLMAAACIAFAATAFADKIVLKDGRTYDGYILEETETSIKIRTPKATLTVPRDQVESIERSSTGMVPERDKRLSELDTKSPASYLDTAKWLAGAGREAFDLGILEHLCQGAASLSPTLACPAQLLLGNELETAGRREDAAVAYNRAAKADPENAEARKKSKAFEKEMQTRALHELRDLEEALDAAISGDPVRAVPKIRKASHTFMADKAKSFLGKTMWELADYFQSRIKCASCRGTGGIECKTCNGKGFSICPSCNGTGRRSVSKSEAETADFARIVCGGCCGTGTILCERCEAERDLKVSFLSKDAHTAKGDVKLHVVAGHERETLATKVNLRGWKSPDGFDVSAISPLPLTKFGKVKCATCGGIPFDANAPMVDPKPLTEYRAAVDDLITGKTPLPSVPPDLLLFDIDMTQQGLHYHEGKWTP